ncbi:MAG: hypothetical protein HON94_02130 [Methylococcales bacterium]|jgi:hypothetical protein|nr:hypothetical protein [Methylococcales bacterium]MBT7409936.1 hypothetical protein [Methylococcales bacterium]
MMYILSITATKNDVDKELMFWAREQSEQLSEAKAIKKLQVDGWMVNEIKSVALTKIDDYFPPCLSYDAFVKAQKEGVAYRVLD